MPSFYSSRSAASQLPLTPPDSTCYGHSNMHYTSDPYAPHRSLSQPRHNTDYEYQGYMQPAVAPAPPAYSFPQGNYHAPNSLPPIQNFYEPLGAPILPPLRIHNRLPYTDGYHQHFEQEQQAREQQQRQAVKEEKATGGVSATLDYDMERMVDFVTEATQTIFHHKMQSPPSFRKWVHQVLSATRLPSATILLSLHYLNDRVAHFPESMSTSENQIYRLLAVSLILGSKFLDDNTFINRSWSDVTAIKVKELNQLEREWLGLINYELHVDPEAPNGVRAWLKAWKDYEQQAPKQHAAHLAPLDTTVQRHSPHRERFSPYPTPYSATAGRSYERSYEHTPMSARNSQYAGTPYAAADPWGSSDRHAFDDFYKRQQRYPTLTELDDVNRRASEERARQSAYAYPQSGHPGYYQPPAYNSGWEQPAWTASHRYDCSCSGCTYSQHYRPYPMSSGYSAQAVMG